MKTQEELYELKQECESLANKLLELTEDELSIVTGGEGENTNPKVKIFQIGLDINF